MTKEEQKRLEELVKAATIMVALGSPIKPSAEFRRTVKIALSNLSLALYNVKFEEDMDHIDEELLLNRQELKNIKDVADRLGTRPVWISTKEIK